MANRYDPMAVEGTWRDPYPKLNLNDDYIGDGYPLCKQLPSNHFLRKGATYRLLGSQKMAEMQTENPYLTFNNLERFQLSTNSSLYKELCNASEPGGACSYQPLIILDKNLVCYDKECGVDNLSVLVVTDDIKYEYVRPPCVEYSFETGNVFKILNRYKKAMCLHGEIDDVAMPACCLTNNPNHHLANHMDYFCDFSFERSSYTTTRSRCQSQNLTNSNENPDTCDWWYFRRHSHVDNNRPGCFEYMHQWEATWHWTNQTCNILAKGKTDY